MKTVFSRGLLITWVLAGVIGCTRQRAEPVDVFSGMVQPADVNSQISIDFGNGGSDIRIEGDELTFAVVNHTEDSFLVMPDTDLLLFQKDGSDWKSVAQGVDYLGASRIVPSKNTGPGAILLFAVPALPNAGLPVALRIVVIGTLLDSQGTPTQQKVGAYVDITLQP